jgi:hypothetical protein
MGRRRDAYTIVVGKPGLKRPLRRPMRGFYGIFKLALQKYYRMSWTELIWFQIRTRGGFCEHGNEPSWLIKCGEFLDYLRMY